MIEQYSFGSMTIDGKIYDYDVELQWTGEVLKWQRDKSHLIDTPDVERAVSKNPSVIVVGTGNMGLAEMSKNCEEFIGGKGIKLIVDRTEEAIKTFNIILEESKEEEGETEKVIGLFHLTC